MEREWRDALLITEPSACSWTTSNSTGSWAEERERGERERERDGGWDPARGREGGRERERVGWKERERERLQSVGDSEGASERMVVEWGRFGGKNEGPDDL